MSKLKLKQIQKDIDDIKQYRILMDRMIAEKESELRKVRVNSKGKVKLQVLYNECDDSMIYANNVAHSEIDEKWCECLYWLKENIGLDVEFTDVGKMRLNDFPDNLETDEFKIILK